MNPEEGIQFAEADNPRSKLILQWKICMNGGEIFIKKELGE